MSDFRDFIPEGQDHSNGKSVFQDFIPAPKLEKIEPVIKPDVELKQEDIDALKEMEEETIENNGGVSVEPEQPVTGEPSNEEPSEPVEPEEEVGLPPEGGNGVPPVEVANEVKEEETPVEPEQPTETVEPKKTSKRSNKKK